MKNIFPVRIFAHDVGTWVSSPRLAEMIWARIRKDPERFKKPLIWYAADLEVLSTESVCLFVYDMKDSCCGGIGDCIYTEVLSEFTDPEKEALNEIITNIYTNEAEAEYDRRKEEERQKIILSIRKELFGV